MLNPRYPILLYSQSARFPRSDEPPRPCNVIGVQLQSRSPGKACTTSVANAWWRNDEWAVCLSFYPVHDY